MLTLLLFALQLQQAPAPRPASEQPAAVSAQPAVEGRGAPTVTIPRIDATIQVDGRLDEEAWSHAARLGGFSQYRPVDSRPAEEQTDVLVWYSPTAIHFGIVARDRNPGAVRATVADRDKLSNDDTVTIYLDTFNDRRRAFFFTVNPLGVQQDGVQTESGFNAGSMGMGGGGGGNMSGSTMDTSPDYQFDSRGQLTSEGYVVEVRIPFKSLRYSGNGPQRWGINVLRKVQRTGYEDTWTDAKRVSSFLAQSGSIDGLHDLKRGMVTELQPVVTTSSTGAWNGADFSRDNPNVQPGVNARFGFTNLSVDATVNPDFSQVESDAGLVTLNERFALFYSEKRPFFLEGIELFNSPNQLVYTRQIVNPIAGGKVTGKMGKTSVAYLLAGDDLSAAVTPSSSAHPLFNIGRIRRDLGADSTAGVTYTDRTTSAGYNRVLAADSRVVFKKLYYVQGQVGESWTGANGAPGRSAPLWLGEFDRTARVWGFNYKVNAIGPDFVSESGYVPRNNIVDARASNRLTWYGKRGAAVESVSGFLTFSRIWQYTDSGDFAAPGSIEGSESLNLSSQMRGGWMASGSLRRQFVVFDQSRYAYYAVTGPDDTLQPYDAPADLRGGHAYSLSMTTPTFQRFNASVSTQRNDVAIYDEASQGLERRQSVSVSMRPTGQLRIDFTTVLSLITRARDESEFARTLIPRLKVEYQATRSLFFRVVGEYRNERRDALRDARTGDLIYVAGLPSMPFAAATLRMDYLVSYKPSPGTVAFIGYGSSLAAPVTARLYDVRRTDDGFFVKLAYLFRR
ncbi:MAG: DUF5916 domain-containing protein [Bacteroidales bacterium]